MRVLNRCRLKDAIQAHADTARALPNWYQVTHPAHWTTFGDVRRAFNSASYADPHVIFNMADQPVTIERASGSAISASYPKRGLAHPTAFGST